MDKQLSDGVTYTGGVEVVWIDGTRTTWPTATAWTAYRAGAPPKETAFTGDIAIVAQDTDQHTDPLAIIGAGTFRWIGWIGATGTDTTRAYEEQPA